MAVLGRVAPLSTDLGLLVIAHHVVLMAPAPADFATAYSAAVGPVGIVVAVVAIVVTGVLAHRGSSR